jgi:hypothetical protein
VDITFDEMICQPNILIPRDSSYPYKSATYWVPWMHPNGLYEFKILQHVPHSELNEGDSEYRFIGTINFAVKDPGMAMVFLQMGYNENKELTISITNVLSGEESVNYIGINHYASISMKYPLRVKRTKDRGAVEKIPPSEETLTKFSNWAIMVRDLIQTKAENYPISIMQILQILDEVSFLLRKGEVKTEYVKLCNTLDTLIWNASSKGILEKKEYTELNNRLNEFKRELFRIRLVNRF